MKNLWTYIENKSWTAATKYKITLLLLSIAAALAGMIVWLLLRTWILSTLDWLICLAGYPVIFSWLFVFFYSCRHDYHDGNPTHTNQETQTLP